MFVDRDHALTTKGDIDHGWLGCCAIGPGQSLDGRKKLLYLIFPVIPLLLDDILFLTLCAAPSLGCD
jgi:hypothetical protein